MPQVLLRFIHISDTHYSPPDYERPASRISPREGMRELIAQVNAVPFQPDFILHTGDVAYDPVPDIYEELEAVLAAFKAPIYYVPGNHDHNAVLQNRLMHRDTVQVPLYHTQDIQGVRFIFLDSNDADVKPPAGRVSDEQLVWLQDQLLLNDPRPIVVAVHHPLQKTYSSEWFDTFMMTVNGDAVHDVLKTAADRIRGVFFGHVHQNILFHRDGILYCTVNSSWTQFHTWPGQDMQTLNALEADPGYNIVTVTDEGLYVQTIHYRVD